MPSVPQAVGTGFTLAKDVGGWLWSEHERSQEIRDVVSRALRLSICRYHPCAEGVDKWVARLEADMWEKAKAVADPGFNPKKSIERKLFRRKIRSTLEFPQWEQQLEGWVKEAAVSVGWDLIKEERPKCMSLPDASELANRFRYLFRKEVWATPERNQHLLGQLRDADNLRQANEARDPTAQWEGAGSTFSGLAVGLAIEAVVKISGTLPEVLIPGGAGALGYAVFRLWQAARKERPTEEQALLHEDARVWVKCFLASRCAGDGSVDELFHRWVLWASAHQSPGLGLNGTEADELDKLIQRGTDCGERRFAQVASQLRDALATDQHSEEVRYALHATIWRLWGPPAFDRP